MAHLWTQGTGGWDVQRLDGEQFDLDAVPIRQAQNPQPAAPRGRVARLFRADHGGVKVWALIASRNSDVRVNSRALLAGLRVLADRDEIRIGGEVQYFSTETLAAVETFSGSDRPAFCGRCRQRIEVGAPAVCCPSCGIWYNQSADLPCWIYADKGT